MKKSIKVLIMVCAIMAMATVPAFCATPVADASVTAAFTDITDSLKLTLAAVAVVAVGIMGTFLAWKYGRKLFGQVAK